MSEFLGSIDPRWLNWVAVFFYLSLAGLVMWKVLTTKRR
jgi:hypothetical protein